MVSGDPPGGPGARGRQLRRVLDVVGGSLQAPALGIALTLMLFGSEHFGGDYGQLHSASRLLKAGRSPYDPNGQHRFFDGRSWRTISYCYPPWLALILMPLSFLPKAVGRFVFAVGNFGGLAAAALLARGTAVEVKRPKEAVALAVMFLPSLWAAGCGQTSPLILLLLVMVWRLLDARHDRLAGLALAWLTIKPQLTAVVIAGLLIWGARQRRWAFVGSFAWMLTALLAISTALRPHWLGEMVEATREIRLLTAAHPEVGVTWSLMLRAVGLKGWPLILGYGLVAVPAVLMVLAVAWRRRSDALEVIALGIPVAFAVSPYDQIYDLTVLLVTVFSALGLSKERRLNAAMIAALLFLPYIHIIGIMTLGISPCSLIWIPVLVSLFYGLSRDLPATPIRIEGAAV